MVLLMSKNFRYSLISGGLKLAAWASFRVWFSFILTSRQSLPNQGLLDFVCVVFCVFCVIISSSVAAAVIAETRLMCRESVVEASKEIFRFCDNNILKV